MVITFAQVLAVGKLLLVENSSEGVGGMEIAILLQRQQILHVLVNANNCANIFFVDTA